MARIHRRTVQKDLHDPDNHDDVITHLEPYIPECEVKWALGGITTNKASGGDGIPVELFQILKDDALKCCTQYASKFGKLSSGHRTGKGQFSLQSQRKTIPKNVQTITQLHSSHMLVKSVSSVAQSCPTLCDPMNRSTPGLPVHQQLPEITQTHVHWVSDVIQLSHPLLSPSPPALNLSQHQGLLKCVSPSHQVAKLLEFKPQHQSFQWTPRTDLL